MNNAVIFVEKTLIEKKEVKKEEVDEDIDIAEISVNNKIDNKRE